MTNDSALFEDDFLLDLDDADLGSAAESPMPQPSEGEVSAASAQGAPEIAAPETAPVSTVALPEPEGGDAPLPAISIRVFYERAETAQLIETAGQDRRMARTDMEQSAGGVAAAIGYLSENVTPNLLIVESSLPAQQMLEQIDALAEH